MTFNQTAKTQPAIAAAIIPVLKDERPPAANRTFETEGLVEALDLSCAFVRFEPVRTPNPATLFGSGMLERLAADLTEQQAEILIVDGTLSPIQQRNLEKKLNLKVMDRTGLILEIFGLRARSSTGRLQVELARLLYERSRLVRTWTHLERQRGGGGFLSGPGETQIESDRRQIDQTIKRIRASLKDVERTRGLHRAGRERRGVPIVALVGYTNAGKSTLFNKLTDASVFAKDMPFATLDPTVRQIDLPGNGQKIAMVDTVGFISDLPTQLIESFQATLDEAMDADLLLHVRDIASPDSHDQAEDVDSVLSDLEDYRGKERPPVIEVWNKIDLLDDPENYNARLEWAGEHERVCLPVSAHSGDGMDALLEAISEMLFLADASFELTVPMSAGDALSWLHENGLIVDAQNADDGTTQTVIVKLSDINVGRFAKLFPSISLSEFSDEQMSALPLS